MAVAALTLCDMVKAVDKSMVIGDIELLEKKAASQVTIVGNEDPYFDSATRRAVADSG